MEFVSYLNIHIGMGSSESIKAVDQTRITYTVLGFSFLNGKRPFDALLSLRKALTLLVGYMLMRSLFNIVKRSAFAIG